MRKHDFLPAFRETVLLGVLLSLLGCGPADLGRIGSPPVTHRSSPTVPTFSSGPGVSITSLSPERVVAGSGDLTLTITGRLFVQPQGHRRTWLVWDSEGLPGTVLAATVDSNTELTVLVPAAVLGAPGVARLTVESSDPMADEPMSRSNSLEFRITESLAASPAPPPLVQLAGFTFTGSMGHPRSWHSATLLQDGSVLFVGGWGEVDLASGAEIFDPTREIFAPVGDPVIRRSGATATLLTDGRVLVVGGYDGQLHRTASAEIYDPATRAFRAVGDMAQARATHRATLLPDGRVLISGGTRDGGGGGAALSTAEIFDPMSETFSTTGSMLSERAEHTATLLPSGKVLIVGGFNGHPADAADDPPWDPLGLEIFDPATGRFSPAGTDGTTRIGHGASLLWDGRILLVGGVWDVQNRHEQPPAPRDSEFFDPSDASFSPAGDIRFSQSGFTFTELSGRQVLLAGGWDRNGPVTRASVIDAATSSVTATPGMLVPRMGHTATLLLDGRVLVTGGNDGQGTVYTSAEVFQ
jgi:hypothetical protein